MMDIENVELMTRMGKFGNELHKFKMTELRRPSVENELDEMELDSCTDLLLTDLMYKQTGLSCNRNDSAVNMSIALWCMGYSEPWLWVSQLCDMVELPPRAKRWWEEHFDRILPYLETWGDIGTSEALAYHL